MLRAGSRRSCLSKTISGSKDLQRTLLGAASRSTAVVSGGPDSLTASFMALVFPR